MKKRKFCPYCGNCLIFKKEGEAQRSYCGKCGFIYENPKPVVIIFPYNEKGVYLIKRGIQPGKGKWALPGGYIENGETPERSAARELYEETNLNAGKLNIIGIYSKNSKAAGYLIIIAYASKVTGTPRAGDDAAAVKFFSFDKIPEVFSPIHKKVILKALKNNANALT